MDAVALDEPREEETHFGHRAFRPGTQRDVFTRADGAQDQQHDAGGDVLQRALQRQADCQTGRAQHGDQAGRLHAEARQDCNDREDAYRPDDRAVEHRHDGGIDLA
ncbi:hypothetical protein G6F57_022363 [Rhizopus arrhizus]|nr:hypothetical protein G6F57_022363 [Rhizopus arrhizus]